MIEIRQVQAKLTGFVGFVRIELEPVHQRIALRIEQQDNENQGCLGPGNHVEEMLNHNRCRGRECTNTTRK